MGVKYTKEYLQEVYGNPAGAEVIDLFVASSSGRDSSYAKNRKVTFKCKCGNIETITLSKLVYSENPDLRCKQCRKETKEKTTKRRFTYDYVKEHFEKEGVTFISEPEEIKNATSYARHLCKNCGCETRVSLTNLFYVNKGHAYTYLCKKCGKNESPTIEKIYEKYFKPYGVKLLTKEYKNAYGNLEFECTCCGKVHHTNYHNLSCSFSNREFLCSECLGREKLKILSDYNAESWDELKHRRTKFDAYFGHHIDEFFNFDSSDYSFHHIYPYYIHHDLATSLTNIFPIKTGLHKYGGKFYSDLHYPLKRPKLNIENYPDEFKLPYQETNYKFDYLGKFIVTEIVIPDFIEENSKVNSDYTYRVDASNIQGLLERKNYWLKKSVLYLPFFISEFMDIHKRNIIRSMLIIRGNKLYNGDGFSKYYGFNVERIYARKCEVKQISSKEAIEFQNETHIQGGVAAKYNYGLFYKEELVGCMSFGVPRANAKNKPGCLELYRLSFKLLTVISGGASKLFNAFIKDINPESIESFCDLRFAAGVDTKDSVYDKLGFELVGKTRPNYWYWDPKNKTFLNRRSYQKHLLKEKLEYFDENLTEKENCLANGLVPQYDCGNARYLWKRKE